MAQKFVKGLVEKDLGNGILAVAIASDATLDRAGEVIDQNGWMLDNFRANPVLLWAHDYYSKPIGKITDIEVRAGRLMFKAQLAVDISEEAAVIYQMFQEGYLNAYSVGFNPIEWKSGNGVDEPYRTYTKAELLEISAVPVPANPNALQLAAAKGLDVKRLGIADAEKFEYQPGLTCEKSTEFMMLKSAITAKEAEIEELRKEDPVVGALCTLPDGSEGHMQPGDDGAMVCVPKAVGDQCTMPDGGEGMMEDHDGSMVCVPKSVIIQGLKDQLSTLQTELERIKSPQPSGDGEPVKVDQERERPLSASALRAIAILQQLDRSIGEALRAAKSHGRIR